MNEEKLLEKIKQSADSYEIPEGLKPENITCRLSDKPTKDMRRRIYQYGGVAAAALVIVIGVAAISGSQGGFNSANSAGIQAESVAEEVVAEVAVASTKDFSEMFKTADEYDDVLDTMDEYEAAEQEQYKIAVNEERSSGVEEIWEDAVMESAPAEAESAPAASMEAPAADTGGGTSDYSTTNLQVEGVDEGDVIKTDGEYIYVISNNRRVRIVKIDGGDMQEVATVTIESGDEENVIEIYLANNKLNIITQGYSNGLRKTGEDTYYMSYRAMTNLYTYDLTNQAKPRLLGKVSQDGDYSTSRKVGDYVYLFTSFYPKYMGSLARGGGDDRFVDMVPYIGEEMIEPANIYLPIQPQTCSYVVITSINLNEPTKIVDKKAILEDSSDFYVTTESIYIRKEHWGRNGDSTSIAKFSFKDGMIKGESAGVVPGRITDTFAINEYKDTLRVLTTVWGNGFRDLENHVTVFDSKMNVIGKIDGLAKGETIYSARFMGDLGYFVTFLNVDPLFAVDFSNPTKPKILSELKITGFSEYMHFYGKDRLLGIGWETDPKTGERLGMKLSMFDIANPENVQEIDKIVVENIDSFPGEYDYKALTVSPERNIIGMTTYSWGERFAGYSYMIFSYEEGKGFKNQMAYTFADNNHDSWEYEKARGLYVGDTFYVVAKDVISAFDMQSGYHKIGELLL